MDGTKHLYDDSVYPNGIAGLPPGEPYLLMAKEIIALYETTASNSHAGDEELVFPKLNEKKMKRLREILRLVITKTMEDLTVQQQKKFLLVAGLQHYGEVFYDPIKEDKLRYSEPVKMLFEHLTGCWIL